MVFEKGVLELGVRLIYPNAQIAECKVNSLPHPLTVSPAYIYLHHPHNLNLNNLIGQLKGAKKTSSFFKSFFKIKSDVLS